MSKGNTSFKVAFSYVPACNNIQVMFFNYNTVVKADNF